MSAVAPLPSSLSLSAEDLAVAVRHWVAGTHAEERAAEITACIQAYAIVSCVDGGGHLASGADMTACHLAGSSNDPIRLAALCFLAYRLHLLDRIEPCRLLLKTAFAGLSVGDPVPPLPGPVAAIVRLCVEALDGRIEVQGVKRLIRHHKLTPDPHDSLNWPWPVRIYTLGRFAVYCEDQPLAFHGKSPRKALELLQALIANGGRDVHAAILMQSLWPEDRASNLRNLFDNTLHRLRHLFGPVDVIRTGNGKLTLDPGQCWVDAWAFNRLTASCSAAPPYSLSPQAQMTDKDAQLAMRLYSGHFLHSEAEESWALPYRDRLRNRFHRLIRNVGARLEQADRWEAAIEVYERGLEIDNLSESFYEHLMLCHQQLGEHAEVLRVYRRCRELLSIVLGVPPSERTEAIRKASSLASR